MGWCFSELELLISSFIEEKPRLCTQCNILTAKGAQGKLSTEYLSSETDWCAIDQSGTGLGAIVTICNNIRIWNKNDLLQYRSQDHLFLRVVIIGCRGLIYNVLLWCGGRWWNATTARASHNNLLSRFLKFSDFFIFQNKTRIEFHVDSRAKGYYLVGMTLLLEKIFWRKNILCDPFYGHDYEGRVELCLKTRACLSSKVWQLANWTTSTLIVGGL